MSVEATAAVWAMRNLKGAQKLVLVRIADHADPNGKNAWPSTARLSADCGLSERTVQTAVKQLIAKGVLSCEPQKGKHGTNLYTVHVKAKPPAESAPPQNLHPADSDVRPPQKTTPTPAASAPEPSITVSRTVQVPPQPPRSVALVPVANGVAKASPIEQVFEAWQEAAGKRKAVLDPKRRALIAKALKAYSVDDLIDAVRGWQHSPHHRGENPSATVYNDLGLLLRDAEHIERFRDLEQQGPAANPRSLSRGARNLQAVMTRREGA